MKKIKKIVAMIMSIVMVMSAMSVGALASSKNIQEDDIKFVVTDENGNEIKEIELEYIEEVAEAYEQRKLMRLHSTRYYNLANGNVSIGGSVSELYVMSTYHFNANSSGRLYYYGECVCPDQPRVDLYDITNDTYKGSAALYDQGSNIYYRSGYFTGLSTSSSQYYSFGMSADVNFSNYYGVMSWSAV